MYYEKTCQEYEGYQNIMNLNLNNEPIDFCFVCLFDFILYVLVTVTVFQLCRYVLVTVTVF